MVTIDVGAAIGCLLAAMGLPAAITGFCFWNIERRIQKREAARERRDEERRKKEENKENSRKKMELLIIQSNGASMALAEATARAVQKIPDAHCNGDMHAALEYATTAKHDLKNFLQEQGVAAIFE